MSLLLRILNMSFYAVHRGRTPGIYATWDECREQTERFSGARYKKFSTLKEAEDFVQGDQDVPVTKKLRPNPEIQGSTVGTAFVTDNVSNQQRRKPAQNTASESLPRQRSVLPAMSNLTSFQSQDPNDQIKKHAPTVVYVDGSSLNNGQRNARAGFGVYFGPNDPRNVSERLHGPIQTNQRAEIQAAIKALELTSPDEPLEVRTDSNYVVQAVTSWSIKWRINGYNGVNGPVKNADLFKILNALVDKRKAPLTWTHVFGHTGLEGNEAADKLANAGALKDQKNYIQ